MIVNKRQLGTYGAIAAALITIYILIIISAMDDTDATKFSTINIDFAFQPAIRNYEDVLSQYNPEASISDQQAYLTELDRLTTVLAQIYVRHSDFMDDMFPLLQQGQALIDAGIILPPQSFTAIDSQGNIVLEFVNDRFTIQMDRWDVSFDGPHGTFILKASD